MKKVLLIVALVALMASPAIAAISGTAHDFAGTGTYNFTTEICAPCHTPHGGSILNNAPLWAHTTSGATFTTYVGVSMDASAAGGPGTVSQLCLSCHDGTVALNAFIGNTSTGTPFITGRANLGTDLTNDHPIGMDYTSATATTDGELVDPSSAGSSGINTTITADMLYSNKVECASCHDVHGNGNTSLLLKSNAGSGLCLTCHNK